MLEYSEQGESEFAGFGESRVVSMILQTPGPHAEKKITKLNAVNGSSWE